MADQRVVVGVFADRAQAEQAMHDLIQAGFTGDRIGFILRDDNQPPTGEKAVTEKLEESEGKSDTGIVTGGVVGGLLGAGAALLIPGLGPALAGGILTTVLSGAAIGATAGSLVGILVNAGVSEEDAHHYEQELQNGRAIVIVDADERPLEAFEILKRNRMHNPGDSPTE